MKSVCHKHKGSAATSGFFVLLPLTDLIENLNYPNDGDEIPQVGKQVLEEISELVDEPKNHSL